MKRIGIFAGSFDPVHGGHISFALQALKAAKLDELYFLLERRPRAKDGVEHFGHRVAMLKQASRPYPKFNVLELEDARFTMERTLPKLQKRFKDDQLVFLFGSDVVTDLANWPKVENLLKNCELVIAVRASDHIDEVNKIIRTWPTEPKALTIFDSYAPQTSSSLVRKALRRRGQANGLLASVKSYSQQNWLYVSLSSDPN